MKRVPDISSTLMKKPASGTHFTLAPEGNRALKLSQCNIVVNPPAEQPERIAFSALSIPFANKSSITAEKILAPLKYKLFVGSTSSTSPVNDDPSQYLILTLFQL
ncbi:hypothetical protein V8G54_001550 [Vigna mungo]|uniref:Uncharacterized protein n=1 Tax=Vigna mungo TaxID=3915 RepID=A0AAQ3P6J0_VIGMU